MYMMFQSSAQLLRIRVEEGGDDPYESNDTWIDAAYIEPGQLISHVLNSGDTDWFCFTVPEDHMTLHVELRLRWRCLPDGLYRTGSCRIWGIRKRQFGARGTRVPAIWYWKLDEKELYYIRLRGGSSEILRSTIITLLPPE